MKDKTAFITGAAKESEEQRQLLFRPLCHVILTTLTKPSQKQKLILKLAEAKPQPIF